MTREVTAEVREKILQTAEAANTFRTTFRTETKKTKTRSMTKTLKTNKENTATSTLKVKAGSHLLCFNCFIPKIS